MSQNPEYIGAAYYLEFISDYDDEVAVKKRTKATYRQKRNKNKLRLVGYSFN